MDGAAPGPVGRDRAPPLGTSRAGAAPWQEARITGTAAASPPPLGDGVRPPPGRPINVIAYLVDALRADHLSLYGYARETSPELRRLAERGVVFASAYAAGPNTLNSVPSMFTSRYPSEANERFKAPPSTVATLAEALAAEAWRRSPALATGRAEPAASPLPLDDDHRRELTDALRALGYVE